MLLMATSKSHQVFPSISVYHHFTYVLVSSSATFIICLFKDILLVCVNVNISHMLWFFRAYV